MISTFTSDRRDRQERQHRRVLLTTLTGLFACASALSPAPAGAAPSKAPTASTTASAGAAGVLAFPPVTDGAAGATGATGADIAGSADSAASSDSSPAASPDRSRSDWWTEDVWQDPDRPFLFYGNPEEEEKAARRAKARSEEEERRDVHDVRVGHDEPEAPTVERLEHVDESDARKEDAQEDAQDSRKAAAPSNGSLLNDPDLTTFTTVKALRAEVERRLERAIMDPTPEHVSAYLEANAFILGKAHRFQVAWERTRFANPQYDWTASHPVANFATAEENERVMREKSVFLKSLGQEAGILFVVRADDPLSELAARSLASFARTNGIEVLVASDRPVTYPGLPPSKPYNALVASLGLTRLPAAVLVPNPAMVAAGTITHPALRANPRPTLFATGVLSVEDLGSRLMLLLAPLTTEATDAVAATRNGRALTTGEAWETQGKSAKSSAPVGSGSPAASASSASARLNSSETLSDRDFARSRAAHEGATDLTDVTGVTAVTGVTGERGETSATPSSLASGVLFPREDRAR